ncbi:Putative GATA transcription factor 22 [Apostasia shenzhenica]|uniref:GATA transcription factor 22 n=1 Tax=Apostasia shenzhenica TaxID=1088818 RepID=A0A2I0B778_9ASPA|nr:Putative GATA transcription factor 22 [Apostasia shenzhenica]
MTPLCHMKQIPNTTFVGGEQHQSCVPFLSLGTTSPSSITVAPSLPFDHFQAHDHTASDTYNLLHPQEEIGKESCYFRNYLADHSSCCDQYERDGGGSHGSAVKWMSSKMRIMRKMMSSDEHRRISKSRRANQQAAVEEQKLQVGNEMIHGGIVRVCSDCSTTKTPLWRSGPRGPKSLCNACGIRQRKARRAMAAAAAAAAAAAVNCGILPATAGKTPEKDNTSGTADRTVPFKKRCRFASADDQTAPEKLGFEDMVVSMNKKSSSFQDVFPEEEKDAAILLMALSCGLICSS